MKDQRKEEIQEGFYKHRKTDMITYVERQDSGLVSYYFETEEPLEILNENVFLRNFERVDPKKVISALEAKLSWIKEMMRKQPITVPDDFAPL